MPKVSKENSFLDWSDYGRPLAKFFVIKIENQKVTAIHLTFLFLLVGLVAVYCILIGKFVIAAFLLVLKSVIDAADGELSRAQNKPSYVGRYLDSIFDLLLNFLILGSICIYTESPWWLFALTFFALQLQGTVYNYYYTILRSIDIEGDTTSRVEELKVPKAMPGENQQTVTLLFYVFKFLYGGFDQLVFLMDNEAKKCQQIPAWFMSLISLYGLGFQLLLIGILLAAGMVHTVLPFLLVYSLLIPLMLILRKTVIKN